MNRYLICAIFLTGLILTQCRAGRDLQVSEIPRAEGIEGMMQFCMAADTIKSILINGAEALLLFDNERYEVEVTLYSRRDSMIYLSAVSGGYEIIRASVDHDSIKVINRLDRIVYRSPLQRRFGYQYPVNFDDLQAILSSYYLCANMERARDDFQERVVFDFDTELIRKRISMDRKLLRMDTFDFYHQRTEKYLMGERTESGFRIYSNFMIAAFEINASGGEISYNRAINVKMDVNPRRYTFTELR